MSNDDIRQVLLESEMKTEDIEIVMNLFDEYEQVPEINSREQFIEMEKAYKQVVSLVSPDDFRSDLGKYVTNLGARLIEWEERMGEQHAK